MSVEIYYNQGSGKFYSGSIGNTPISFSSLRTNFKEESSGAVKVSELIRNTSTSSTNPIVPDCKENQDLGIVATASNWKASYFYNSIKYYGIRQSGTNEVLDIASPGLSSPVTNWNTNLTKNIKKFFYVDGTIGSTTISSYAATFDTEAYNFTIRVRNGGTITGKGGASNSGNGGPALYVNSTGNSATVDVADVSSYIRGGGGGGARGFDGWTGPNGPCWITSTYQTAGGCEYCNGCGNPNNPITINGVTYNSQNARSTGGCNGQQGCSCAFGWYNGTFCTKTKLANRNCAVDHPYSKPGAPGGIGGTGGVGQGYQQASAGSGASGTNGGATSCPTYGNAGENGGTGGTGGTYGSAGGSTTRDTASITALQNAYYSAPSSGYNGASGGTAGRAITGSNYSKTGVTNNILGLS